MTFPGDPRNTGAFSAKFFEAEGLLDKETLIKRLAHMGLKVLAGTVAIFNTMPMPNR